MKRKHHKRLFCLCCGFGKVYGDKCLHAEICFCPQPGTLVGNFNCLPTGFLSPHICLFLLFSPPALINKTFPSLHFFYFVLTVVCISIFSTSVCLEHPGMNTFLLFFQRNSNPSRIVNKMLLPVGCLKTRGEMGKFFGLEQLYMFQITCTQNVEIQERHQYWTGPHICYLESQFQG